MKLTVRRAIPTDIGTLVTLMRDFYAESGFPLDHRLAANTLLGLLSNPALGCIWLAHSGHVPVGHAVLTVRFTMEHSGLSGYIDDLYVMPEFRRMGAGHNLLTELFDECRTRGCKSMQVEVGETNAPALALYAKVGLHAARDGRVLASGRVPEART